MRGTRGARRSFAAVVAAVAAAAIVVAAAGTAGAAGSGTSNNAGIEALQRQLNSLGCQAGPVDGKLGGDTQTAIRWFQTAAGLTADGIVGALTAGQLLQAACAGTPTCTSVPKPGAPPKPATAGPPCTEALLASAVQSSLLANERIVLTGPYQCAGIWTYNAPTIASGNSQSQVPQLLRWNGSAWQVVNRALYCENGSVPSLIYKQTCLAGASAKTNPNASDAAGIQALQRQLNSLGCNAGSVDGKLGPNTLQALRWFQAGAGITVDGILGPVTSAKLAAAATAGSPNCRSVPAPAPPTTTTTTGGKGGPTVHPGPHPGGGQGGAAPGRADREVRTVPVRRRVDLQRPDRLERREADRGRESHELERERVAGGEPGALLRERQRARADHQAGLPLVTAGRVPRRAPAPRRGGVSPGRGRRGGRGARGGGAPPA